VLSVRLFVADGTFDRRVVERPLTHFAGIKGVARLVELDTSEVRRLTKLSADSHIKPTLPSAGPVGAR